MQRIRSIGIMSLARISGVIYGCLGLLVIPFFGVAGLISLAAGEKETAVGGAMFLLFAILAPFLYGFIGFLAGALTAWIYNLAAKWIGGIEIDLQPPQTTGHTTPSANFGLV